MKLEQLQFIVDKVDSLKQDTMSASFSGCINEDKSATLLINIAMKVSPQRQKQYSVNEIIMNVLNAYLESFHTDKQGFVPPPDPKIH